MAHWRQWHQVSLGLLPAWSSATPIQPDYLPQCPWSPLLLAPCQWAILGVSHHSCTRLHKWWIANFVHIQEGCTQMYLQYQCSWHGSHMHLWAVQDRSLLLGVQNQHPAKCYWSSHPCAGWRGVWNNGEGSWGLLQTPWQSWSVCSKPEPQLNLHGSQATGQGYIFLHCSHLYNYYKYSRTLCIKCWVSAFRTELQHFIKKMCLLCGYHWKMG